MGWSSEEDVLSLSEARHRMANVFQLLTTVGRLRVTRTTDAEAKVKLGWMVEALGALGVVQRRMLTFGGEDFAAVLNDLAPTWRRLAGSQPVIIQIDVEPCPASEQAAPALALIVQELVGNALSHAFPDGRQGVVKVELKRLDGNRAALSVSDDGVGYDPDGVDTGRLGLWLIKGLAEQVDGILTTQCGQGVATRLEFPLA